MALHLVKAGHEVKVYNRTASKMEPLIIEGAKSAESYAGAADGSDVVITMLSDSPDVREVILGSNGVLKGCKPGTVIIDMSTISPAVAKDIAARCVNNGVEFLDAPVTGGETGAVAGTLSILVGGKEAVLEHVRPVFDVMGSRITYMGPSGSGQAAKLCNQVICGLNILAVCEGMALAEASGIDKKVLLEAISTGAAGSWMLSNLGPKMIAEDWAPGFKIALQQKDLRLALESACESKLPLMGTALVQQILRIAEAGGCSDEGTQAAIKAVLKLGYLG